MKKRLILTILAFIVVLQLAGCSNTNLKRPEVTKEGTLIHEVVIMPNNTILYDTTYTNDGKILSYTSNYPQNEIVRNYEYNAEGKLVKETEDLIGQGYYNEYVFDDNENLLTYSKQQKDSNYNPTIYSYSYSFDADGNPTECYVSYKDMQKNVTKICWTKTYENGKLVKAYEYGKEHYPFFDANIYNDCEVLYNDKELVSKITFEDQDGKVVETISYNENGDMTLIWSELNNAEVDSFKYDEEGSQINYLGAARYTYEYDEFGNKIKRIAYSAAGEQGFYTTYEYYYAD